MSTSTEPRADSKNRRAALYRLLAWLSPSFPVGAFSYSHGLEAAAAAEAVYDRATLQSWIAAIVAQGSGRIDADILCDSYRAAEAGDLDDRLGRGAHPEIAAIVELEPVAFREMLGPRQIEQERRPGIRDQADAPAVPVEKRQGHAVDRGLLGPLAARMHRYRPPHKFTTENFTMRR